jgi:hypothetical protein
MTHPMVPLQASGLLPPWLALLGAVVFAVVALSHGRHLLRTAGQRRPWHACHVLMAVAMVFMYAAGAGGVGPGIAAFWRLALAAAGVLAVLWALWGGAETVNPVWLLTALDLGAMLFMWSPRTSGGAAGALVVFYLLGDAVLWACDAHRSLERGPTLLRWLPVGDPAGASPALASGVARTDGLLGDLDVSPSMVLMSLGMAYMVLAMQLAR